jgi:hypothetical protein
VKGKEPIFNEQTFDKLYGRKLCGMAEGFKEQLQQPNLYNLSFEERFGLLVDRQWTFKEDGRLKRLLQKAKLKMNACAEDIDYKSPRGIDKGVIDKSYIFMNFNFFPKLDIGGNGLQVHKETTG